MASGQTASGRRLSRARIREFFIEWFELQLSTRMLDETIREAGRAVAPLEDEMVLDIEQAALLHADETPWKEAGQPLWLWLFVASFTTLFLVCSRGLAILSNVLTTKLTGNLMSDGYQAYRHFGRRCWAHLISNFVEPGNCGSRELHGVVSENRIGERPVWRAKLRPASHRRASDLRRKAGRVGGNRSPEDGHGNDNPRK